MLMKSTFFRSAYFSQLSIKQNPMLSTAHWRLDPLIPRRPRPYPFTPSPPPKLNVTRLALLAAAYSRTVALPRQIISANHRAWFVPVNGLSRY